LITALHMVRFYAGRHRYRHRFWVIEHAINTSGRMRVAARHHPWHPRKLGTLYLYPPGTVYWEEYSGDRKARCEFAFVLFLGGEAAGLDSLIPPRVGYARFQDPDGLAAARLEEMVRIGQERGDAGIWQAQAALCGLIGLLHQSQPAEEGYRLIGHPVPVAPLSDLARETDAYFVAHLGGRILLADLAKHLKISVSSLSHRYHHETGETPMDRLLQLRLNQAKALLLSGQKLHAVVQATGFSDAPHLSRVFKRAEGVSPRQYLRAMAAPGQAARAPGR
jgi:AraC-like DNA-binding protein